MGKMGKKKKAIMILINVAEDAIGRKLKEKERKKIEVIVIKFFQKNKKVNLEKTIDVMAKKYLLWHYNKISKSELLRQYIWFFEIN